MNLHCKRCVEWGDFCSPACAESYADTLPELPAAATGDDSGSWDQAGKTLPKPVYRLDGLDEKPR